MAAGSDVLVMGVVVMTEVTVTGAAAALFRM